MEKLCIDTREALKKKTILQSYSTGYSDAGYSLVDTSDFLETLSRRRSGSTKRWSISQPQLNSFGKQPTGKPETGQSKNNAEFSGIEKCCYESSGGNVELCERRDIINNEESIGFIEPLEILSQQQNLIPCCSSSTTDDDGINNLNVSTSGNYKDNENVNKFYWSNRESLEDVGSKKARFLKELDSYWSFSDCESRDTNSRLQDSEISERSKNCLAEAECKAFFSSPDLTRSSKKIGHQNLICQTTASVSDPNPFLALAKAAAQAASKTIATKQHRWLSDKNISLLISSTLSLNDYCDKENFPEFIGPTTNAYRNIEKILNLPTIDNKKKSNVDVEKMTECEENMKNFTTSKVGAIDHDKLTGDMLKQMLSDLPKHEKTTYEEIVLRMLNRTATSKEDEQSNGHQFLKDTSINDTLDSTGTSVDYRLFMQSEEEKQREKLSMMHNNYTELIKRTQNAKLNYLASISKPADVHKRLENGDSSFTTKVFETVGLSLNNRRLMEDINQLIRNNLLQHYVVPKQAIDVKPCYAEPKKAERDDSDDEFESIVEKAKRSWASNYKQRQTIPTTSYLLNSQNLNGEKEAGSFELVDAEETSNKEIKGERKTAKVKMADLRRKTKGAVGDREIRSLRTKSVDYLADKNTNKNEVEPPENQLKKILGEQRTAEDDRRLSEHELRFRKSLEKLQIPDWYLNSEHCWSNKPIRTNRQWPTSRNGSIKTSESSSGLEHPVSVPNSPWTTNKPLAAAKMRQTGSYTPKAQTPLIIAKFTEAPKYIIDSPEKEDRPKEPETIIDTRPLKPENGNVKTSSTSIDIPKSFFERFKWEIEEARKNRINHKLINASNQPCSSDAASKAVKPKALSSPPVLAANPPVKETSFTNLPVRVMGPSAAYTRGSSEPPAEIHAVNRPVKETSFVDAVAGETVDTVTVKKSSSAATGSISTVGPQVANGAINKISNVNPVKLAPTGHRIIIIEASDVLQGKNSEPPDPYVNASTLKEVMDNLFELSKITPKVQYKAPAHRIYNEVWQSYGSQVVEQPSDYGIFTLNKTVMNTCEKIPEIAGNLLKKEILWINCDRCKQRHPMDEFGVQYVACRYCYTYYCSPDCLKISQPNHSTKCGYAKVASLAKRVLNKIRSDDESRRLINNVAELGYKQRGRGCVNFVLKGDLTATSFINNGWAGLNRLPEECLHYQPIEQLKNLDTKLILAALNYNTDNDCLLKVCILIDKDDNGQESAAIPVVNSPSVTNVLNDKQDSVSSPTVTSASKQTQDIKAKSASPVSSVEVQKNAKENFTQNSRPFERSRSLPYRKKPKQEIDAKLVLKSVLKSLENIVPDRDNELQDEEKPELERKNSTPTSPTSGSFNRKSSYRHSVGISGRKYYRSDGSFSPITWDVNSSERKEFKFPTIETDV